MRGRILPASKTTRRLVLATATCQNNARSGGTPDMATNFDKVTLTPTSSPIRMINIVGEARWIMTRCCGRCRQAVCVAHFGSSIHLSTATVTHSKHDAPFVSVDWVGPSCRNGPASGGCRRAVVVHAQRVVVFLVLIIRLGRTGTRPFSLRASRHQDCLAAFARDQGGLVGGTGTGPRLASQLERHGRLVVSAETGL